MTYNAANRKHIRSAEKDLKSIDEVERDVISGIMSVPNGRLWMFNLLGLAQTYADPFTPDPYTHAYHAGKKSLGTYLHGQIMLYAPSQYEIMLREAYERNTVADARRTARDPAAADGDDAAEFDAA